MAESTMNIIKIQDTVGDNHKIGAETATKLQSSLSESGTSNLYAVGTDGKSIVYFNNGIPVKSTANLGSTSTPLYLKSGVLTTATDANTKVTSASNHYGYSSGSEKASGLYKIATDDAGHVTSVTTVSKEDITALGIPSANTDTKNTAGATDTSNKIYLIGATAQTANPQTYSSNEVFVDTDADLNAPTVTATNNRFNFGSNAYAEYNTTNKCINFIFN